MESSIENVLLEDECVGQSTSDCNTVPFEDFGISDTFRMSLDHHSIIGENVTIEEKDAVDCLKLKLTELPQPATPANTPVVLSSPISTSPPIIETPKVTDEINLKNKLQPFLKLSLNKHKDDVFVKPSPVAEIMSPAKMLQFEIDLTTSSTPTMKRAAIDFNFFNENNFEEYFTDVPQNLRKPDEEKKCDTYIETPVIVKADTVRHEIGYGQEIHQHIIYAHIHC